MPGLELLLTSAEGRSVVAGRTAVVAGRQFVQTLWRFFARKPCAWEPSVQHGIYVNFYRRRYDDLRRYGDTSPGASTGFYLRSVLNCQDEPNLC